jgi:glycogen debranching enzyme
MKDALNIASLDKEWLLCNGRGGFASGTAVGVLTRRYHGLLLVAARPPLERWMLLNAVLEKITLDDAATELANFEFEHLFHPRGYEWLADFAYDLSPARPWVRFTYRWAGVSVVKWILLRAGCDEVELRYDISVPPGQEIRFEILPLASMRDFHAVLRGWCAMKLSPGAGGFMLRGPHRMCPELMVHAVKSGPAGPPEPLLFDPAEDWWHGFQYRVEKARGMDYQEDLFAPGWFRSHGSGEFRVTLRAWAQPSPVRDDAPAPPAAEDVGVATEPLPVTERLAQAARQFMVDRRMAKGGWSRTILAGYPWFGDWGRDAFIAMPGLLLRDGRFDEAREVLCTFASAQRDGLIPNRFSDYGDGCDYNSVDASLWFIHSADAYLAASGDLATWRDVLLLTCEHIVDAFMKGTRFDIRMEADGLISAGNPSTQITWMDAKCGGVVFTPRHGKCVEVNALWYHVLCRLAERSADGGKYASLARRVKRGYVTAFWNAEGRYLYDCVRPGERDAAIRPNQIFAVSLPNSPLEAAHQAAVVECVRQHLLTPYGLRSLAPSDPHYHGRYEGGLMERDGAYHQGTVWAWLIGPYVEAYLRVHAFSDDAKACCRELLQPLVKHLDEAGLGSVSEVFDGDPPHRPGGCFAQAWSVAELRRALAMVEY